MSEQSWRHLCFGSAPAIMKVTLAESQFPQGTGFDVEEEDKATSLWQAKSFQYGPITVNV